MALPLLEMRALLTLAWICTATMSAPVLKDRLMAPRPSTNASNPVTNCPVLHPTEPPQDVSDLRFTDIKVVGGMGDSITAGFALTNLPSDSRGQTWCCGDNEGAVTVSNFFRHYTADVLSGVKFNLAVSGSKVQGMARQAERWIEAVRSEPGIDAEHDWKLLNIWIGPNNECTSCRMEEANQPPAYERELRAAIDILQAGSPRTFVNLISMTNLTGLVTAEGAKEQCILQHAALTPVLCPCAFGSDEEAVHMDTVVQANNQILFQIQDEIREKRLKDFAVIVQPGLQEMRIPDWTYLSRLDCFHPSLLAHQEVAKGVWNNMMQPVGEKTTGFEPPVQLACPTESSVIRS